ncbi:ImmA/IrrE family metallo-endopeptidase [Clostridium kluyveri]|uniref:ImmA/IrrE family metallo-endopeptidase n=1 Tax=Clostridium kluyveri TaxID=1534 RepID=UPI00224692C3|nr:ImmA/IrrE family metallo-endopeptidase [Clostridium kluyveri]UZQ50596.1 ImmA/IrrE family metallo-endopeptidase [Clostridium kluyveri]
MNIPKYARYNYCCEMANEFLVNENITSLPFDADTIIKKHKWAKLKYSSLAKQHNITIRDISEAYGSNDAYTIFNGRNYTIAYNDTLYAKRRIYFTKLHEIGHIYLKHFTDFNETILSRYNMTKTQYKVLENEANCFARNVLIPPILIKESGLKNIYKLSSIFEITKPAAKTRLDLLTDDLKCLSNNTKILQKKFFYNFIHKKHCSNCGYTFISERAKYCPVCGENKLSRGDANMTIDFNNDGIELNDNGKASKCPNCKNKEMEEDGSHCRICGVYLINKCTNKDGIHGEDERGYDIEIKPKCGKIAAGNARFCEYCGEPTTFYIQGLLKDWKTGKTYSELQKEKAEEEAAAQKQSLDDGDLPF